MKKIKVDDKLIEKLKPFWQKVIKVTDTYEKALAKLEKEMAKEIGIEDIVFVWELDIRGIGNDSRTMRLIHDRELEKRC